MRLKAIGREYLPSDRARELMKVTHDRTGYSRVLQFPHAYGDVIIIDDPNQLWGELLAYAGSPPPDEDPRVLPWIQDVLKALSEMYPHSSSRSRLDTMVDFSNYCKEKRE
ncbi:hypothetical protein LCGC14_1900880 [marine sediment metagenome]|uniref:Uncharacterized protein n=1 Tax=marine sediment metagenome TaxID=412755 RepID=A0A0F9FWY0_9ZZZZ